MSNLNELNSIDRLKPGPVCEFVVPTEVFNDLDRPKSAILGLNDESSKIFLLTNHL